jgi:hypothetical protein
MNKSYFEDLYPFQDQVLKVISAVETDFYLTGGTAAFPRIPEPPLFR